MIALLLSLNLTLNLVSTLNWYVAFRQITSLKALFEFNLLSHQK